MHPCILLRHKFQSMARSHRVMPDVCCSTVLLPQGATCATLPAPVLTFTHNPCVLLFVCGPFLLLRSFWVTAGCSLMMHKHRCWR